jgi:hypothetical protein
MPLDWTWIGGIVVAVSGAVFWIATQWNIIRTKNKISETVRKAVKNLEGMVEERFTAMKSENERSLETKILELSKGLDQTTIQKGLEGQINGLWEQLRVDLGQTFIQVQDQTLESIKKYYASTKSAEVRGLMAELNELSPDIAQYLEGVKGEFAKGDLDPKKLAALKILDRKVPDKYAAEHPFEAMILDLGKAKALEFINQGQEGIKSGKGNKQLSLNPYGQ